MIRPYYKKILIIVALITAGLTLELAGLLDVDNMLLLAREYADRWWLVVLLIVLQIILFTFALAGSFFLWIVAPLYPPLMATLILAAGGTLGGVTAYLFSKRLTDDWIQKIETSRTYRLLHKQDNFFALFALRVFPAFPHSLVNYSSGILKVRLSHFIAAAILGISIKSYLYARVIYDAATTATITDLLDISIYGPLLLLSAITFAGIFVNIRTKARAEKNAKKAAL